MEQVNDRALCLVDVNLLPTTHRITGLWRDFIEL